MGATSKDKSSSSFFGNFSLPSAGLVLLAGVAVVQMQQSLIAETSRQIAALSEQVATLRGTQEAVLSRLDRSDSHSDEGIFGSSLAAEYTPERVTSRKIYHEDFPKVFGIRLLHEVEEDPELTKYLDSWDVRRDSTYSYDPEEAERLGATLGRYIDQGFADDRRFYVRWADAKRGYGLFADVPVTKNQVVGVYTGQLLNSSISDYQWQYQTYDLKDSNGNTLNLGVDGRYAGNWLRFVNHADKPNTDAVFVPYRNRWWILYVSNRIIHAGEEVTVSYGNAYWETREKVDV
ncbi:hypothetical protein HK102_000541 [Quaeritorhiza haematococci]|nr:hypothetical protein HK102_000541 [Quaeritorhiza haematococci]